MASSWDLKPGERRLPRAGGFNPDIELIRQQQRAVAAQGMASSSGDPSVVACGVLPEKYVLVKSRCGQDRDCVPDDRTNPFFVAWCGALSWCSLGNGRFVEIWNQQNTVRLLKVTGRTVTAARSAKCVGSKEYIARQSAGSEAEPDPFTINLPGLTDIVKLPGMDSADLRRQRIARMRSAHSPLPQGLQWIPPLLNKLDDAQDILFTALAVGAAAARWLGFRAIPGLGIALTVNDLLNGFG